METINLVRYKCSICGTTYDIEKEALECESRPISQDKGVKIGDKVFITRGDGSGNIATVSSVFVYDKHWGHYFWETYWHTIGLTAKLDDAPGSRQLTFDSYEPYNV
jgi:hypothetical protein